MINDGNLTLYISHKLDELSDNESIGFGDINIEYSPDCSDFMTADQYGNCRCTNPTQNYDANSKQCCDASCTRCYGKEK